MDSNRFYIAYVVQKAPDTMTHIDLFFTLEPGTTQARTNRILPLVLFLPKPTIKGYDSLDTSLSVHAINGQKF